MSKLLHRKTKIRVLQAKLEDANLKLAEIGHPSKVDKCNEHQRDCLLDQIAKIEPTLENLKDSRSRSLAFGICVLCAVVVAIFALADVRLAIRARSWVQVPATIESVRLSYGSDLGRHQLECKYKYLYNGTEFTNSRTSLRGWSQSIDDKRYSILRDHQKHDRPYSCWVNPKCHKEAILFRDFVIIDQGPSFFVSFFFLIIGVGFAKGKP